MRTIKAKCTDCGMDTEITLATRKFGRGLEETFFTCEVCHVHTTCFITNAKTRKLIAETTAIRDKRIKSALDVATVRRNQAKIDATMDELKRKHGK